ncbi:uncharacterized protein LOC124681855 [Lolium rigidum]|uniref:uncharacterized protein LOC124681855 n=1 Tax=Lolium rigidum TaxID=89674 RepID=UPI001F5D4476|nr:uncharacterized protein LOC124681855 [Lolium rigidum]XP_047072593.1 uncharacterized protein LOC124681855 [Lolium rigidum]
MCLRRQRAWPWKLVPFKGGWKAKTTYSTNLFLNSAVERAASVTIPSIGWEATGCFEFGGDARPWLRIVRLLSQARARFSCCYWAYAKHGARRASSLLAAKARHNGCDAGSRCAPMAMERTSYRLFIHP